MNIIFANSGLFCYFPFQFSSTRKRTLIFFFLIFLATESKPQGISSNAAYKSAYDSLYAMLAGVENLSFKKAVFISENAYYDNQLSYEEFLSKITNLSLLAKTWIKSNSLVQYKYPDSLEVIQSFAIYKIMEDTIKLRLSDNKIYQVLPYRYDFNDFFAQKNWVNMFVTKLLSTNSGNCHSLPYLYKVLCDELGVTHAWLSFAPYHIYIKNHCEGFGWYNTELTSGQFPTDAWIMSCGYVSADAVRSGIYMDTLSDKEAVANCALDLAKGYERKYNIYTDSFIIRCCDLTLKYHATNINAIIYKAEILKKMYLIYRKDNPVLASAIYPEMERLFIQALDLGYKEMPEKMYKEWLLAVTKQKEKYSNKRLSDVLKKKK